MTDIVWINDVCGHEVGPELDRMEAEVVTARIKSYVGVAWVLLYEAHQRKAHKAMGYETWADYVAAEFDMSRSRSYQLISQAKVVLEISAAVSTDVDITERTARDLIENDAVAEAARAAADAMSTMVDTATEAEKAKAAEDAIEGARWNAVERARARREAEQAAREAAGMNADGEISGGEGREDEGGSDDAPATEQGSGEEEVPAPPTPPLSGQAHPDDSYRARMSREMAAVRNGLLQLDPDETGAVVYVQMRFELLDREQVEAYILNLSKSRDTFSERISAARAVLAYMKEHPECERAGDALNALGMAA